MPRLLAALVFFVLSACSGRPEVSVDGEVLVGEFYEDTSIAVFRGVPFAEPPLGDLRWRAPQPIKTKVPRRETKEFAPACMQSMRILDWYRYLAETFGGSRDYYPDLEVDEDCLYLNVWTSTLASDAKLPVMIWVHGGSNRSGWSYEPNYRGHALAQHGVVVVSIAYRVGAFGFLSHPGLSRDEPVANFGIWDQIAALRWVQDNIAQFGGDPDRVTLFGESSGAEDALALVFADAADGLFDRVILQSTAGYGIGKMPTLADEQERGLRFADIMGFTGVDSLALLRGASAEALLKAYEESFSDYYHSPAIDNQLFNASTWADINSANFGDLQIVVGTNRDEWLDYISVDATMADVRRTANELMYIDSAGALAAVADEHDPRRAMDRLITADNYVCASQYMAAKSAAAANGTWMYYFTRAREDVGGHKAGAFHGAEYSYVFGTHDAYMNTNAVDSALTNTIMGYWTQFAATGNPNSDELPNWPAYGAPDFFVQELGDKVLTIPAPEPELCRLFGDWADGDG